MAEAKAAATNTIAVETVRGEIQRKTITLQQNHDSDMKKAEYEFKLKMKDKEKEFMIEQMNLTMDQAEQQQELRERQFTNVTSQQVILENKVKESEFNLAKKWERDEKDQTNRLANLDSDKAEQRERDKKKWNASFESTQASIDCEKLISKSLDNSLRIKTSVSR
jgi:hypothetical protein